MKKEASLHDAVARYLAYQYPKAIFNTDLSGIRLTMGQSTQVKKLRSANAFPDLVIYETTEIHCGLFIELKAGDRKLTRRDGYLVADKRIRRQNEMLHALEKRGYLARFGHGFDQTQKLIDWYMNFDELPLEESSVVPIPKYFAPPEEETGPMLGFK